MDSTKKNSLVAVGNGDAEKKIQDNRQLLLDAGRRVEIDDNGITRSLIMELYPWIQQFKKMCRTSLFQPSMMTLKNLMMYYTRNVRLSVNECYTKPLRAEKLKDSISETLLFFLYYYREIDDHDRALYMDLMTDLLAMYIDMELKASKKGREHNSKIAARLSSSLHVYLEHSAEHLLDTLLKVHFMTHNYHEILDPVLTKIFKGIQEHPNSSIMYVRYFLAYRLWKKINKDVAVKNQINVSALASLGPAPTDFPSFIIESVLPKVPNSQKLSTKSLLLQKFDVDKCCEEFTKFCKRERGLNVSKGDQRTCPANTQLSSVPEDNDTRVSINHNNVINECNEPKVKSSSPNLLIQENDKNSKKVSFSKAASPLKLSALRKTKKSNNIVFIDLTSDNVTEKIIRQKKTRRKLFWLEKAKKRINAKMIPKKIDSTTEDVAPTVQQFEDTMNLDSLCIESPRCQESTDMEVIVTEETSAEEQTTLEDVQQAGKGVSEESTIKQAELPMSSIINNSDEHCELNDCNQPILLENIKNSAEGKITNDGETKVLEVASSISNISTTEAEKTPNATGDSRGTDEFFNTTKRINDKRELPSCDATSVRDRESRTSEPMKFENNKALEIHPDSIQVAIKAEHVNDETYEIINEEVVSSEVELPVVDTASRVSLEMNCKEIEQVADSSSKIQETEFQDSIDGLSLLASVSQRVSHLKTTSQSTRSHPVNGELIKVKNYASLVNLNTINESVTSSDTLPIDFCNGNPTEGEVINRIVSIYPEDAMEKVAYQVEVTSTSEIHHYENEYDEVVKDVVTFQTNTEDSCRNNQMQCTSAVSVENTNQAEKDDTNVILNGETVVLFQKSPNSNLYIINKAVENRDHGNDEISSGIRDITEHTNETGAFSYEFPYDNVYRNQSSLPYDLTQYNRDVSTQESKRNKKVIVGGDSALEANKANDGMELVKPGKNIGLPLDVIGKGTTGKRNNSAMSRRRRIKHEYNGCGSDLSRHIAPNYGIQECSQEHVESSRSSIHIPVTHSSPLSSIYTTYTGGAELYLPCHKNCNSMACGLSVNSNGSASGKGCSCLNCTYGIVAHCGECILPNSETRTSSIDNSPYYLPIHSTVQPSAVQDCSGKDPLVKIFDDKLVCKLENTILNSNKPLDNVEVKCEPKEIYRAQFDNKLPLKKRFKAMMSVSFEETSIKREKTQSYPGTPMLSIAALNSQDGLRTECAEGSAGSNSSLDLSLQEQEKTEISLHHANEMIRRDYHKDMIMSSSSSSTPNGCRNRNSGGNGERKKKRRTTPLSCSVDETRHEGNYQKISKTLIKRKETTTTSGIVSKRVTTPNKSQARPSEKVNESDGAPNKNSTRRTRSSKRNMPKVNYIYADGDSDWNPSGGGSKRKSKKTSR